MDQGVPSGTPAVNASKCPSCGTELGPYDLVCWSCGTKLRQLPPVVNPTPQERELHGIASGAIANAMTNLLAGRKLGVRLGLAEDLLDSAKKAAIQGNFVVALELASRSAEEAETLTIAFDALQVRLRKARVLMEAAREDGADVSEAERLLEMAEGAGEAGDYRGALRYAIKAAQNLDDRRSVRSAWKVEIGDWLK